MTVISDGTIVDSSLKFLDLTRDDLNIILKKENKTAREIFLMTLNKSGQAIIINKENKERKK